MRKFSFGPLPSDHNSGKADGSSSMHKENIPPKNDDISNENEPPGGEGKKRKQGKSNWNVVYHKLLGSNDEKLEESLDDSLLPPQLTSSPFRNNNNQDHIAWDIASSSPIDTTNMATPLGKPTEKVHHSGLKAIEFVASNDPATELLDKYRPSKDSDVHLPSWPFDDESEKRVLRRTESAFVSTTNETKKLAKGANPLKLRELCSPGNFSRSISSGNINIKRVKNTTTSRHSSMPAMNSTENGDKNNVLRLLSLADKISYQSEASINRESFETEKDLDTLELDKLNSSPIQNGSSPIKKNNVNFQLPESDDFDIDFDELDQLKNNTQVKPTGIISEEHQLIVPDWSKVATPNNETGDLLAFSESDGDSIDFDQLEQLAKNSTNEEKVVDIKLAKTTRSKVEQNEILPIRSTINKPELRRYAVVQAIESSYQKTQPQIEVMVIDSFRAPKRILLRGCWTEVMPKKEDIIHVIGNYDESIEEVIVDNDQNLLIINPDILLTCTTITASFVCQRRVSLNERIRLTAEPPNEHMLSGTIIHEIFQTCLTEKNFALDYMIDRLNELIKTKYHEEIIIGGMNADELSEQIKSGLPKLKEWEQTYFRQSPNQYSTVTEHRGGNTRPLLSVSKVLEIEEEIWSPMYGIKGKIDVTVECTVKDAVSQGIYLAPFEIKTAKFSQNISHRAQTTLYSLLASDRYNIDVQFGVLCYTHTGEMIKIPVYRNEVQSLLSRRNELAQYISVHKRQLPEVIGSEFQCSNCARLDSCMVSHRFIENGNAETSGVPDKFEKHTAFLTERHQQFYNQWDSLISKEALTMDTHFKEIWTMTSKYREQSGMCYGRLIVKPDVDGTLSTGNGIFRYKLQRERSENGGKLPHLDSKFNMGDFIIVSDESGNICIASGVLRSINRHELEIDVNRDITVGIRRMPGFSEEGNQVFYPSIPTNKETANNFFGKSSSTLFRIDKDDVAIGMALSRGNLMQLFTKNGDRKRRRLIVDLEKPEFLDIARPYKVPDFDKYNKDQLHAIEQVMKAEDYVLMLGMPGTGKTSTIAAIVKALVAQNKTVLLASFTNSAVDNIILKIKDSHFKILRVGSALRVHPDVQEYLPTRQMQAKSESELRDMYYNSPVVGTTCYMINNWVFGKRTFDYCIIDEASQITLPACLGPLRLADKFILVGDHYQLSPLVRSSEAVEGGFDVSLFKYLCENQPQAVVNLSYQYRMCQDIMLLSNKLIYDGHLKCGSEEVASQSLAIPNKEILEVIKGPEVNDQNNWLEYVMNEKCKVMFLNTDRVPAKENSHNDRITNEVEAEIVRQIVEGLCMAGVSESSIGVITVYRSQLRILTRHMRNRTRLETLTADRFQGRDKDCIIISLVRSNDNDQVGDLLKDWRRLNVSFTRAKSKLIIIGSRRTLESAQALNEFLKLIDIQGWMCNLPPRCTLLYNLPEPFQTPQKSVTIPKLLSSGNKMNDENVNLSPSRRARKKQVTAKRIKAGNEILGNKPILRDVINDISG